MGYIIGVTGKGGTGKTTIAGLMTVSLVRRGMRPVLAVDADPNSCLDGVLGVKIKKTVGGVREEAREQASQSAAQGVAKRDWLELKVAQSLVEGEDFDLIAMGRPEGPGCYCYANNVLKDIIAAIAKNYPFTVIDNEAGLENLSRRIVKHVDLLVMAGDPSARGLETIRRLYGLAHEMGIDYSRLALIINRVRGDSAHPGIEELARAVHADSLVLLPDDDELASWGERGESLFTLPAANPVAAKIDSFISTTVGEKAHGKG